MEKVLKRFFIGYALLLVCAFLICRFDDKAVERIAKAQGYTETFYVCKGGDGSLPETATCATAWDSDDLNDISNWDTDDSDDGKIGPNDHVVSLSTGGRFHKQLYAQTSGLSTKPITISSSGTVIIDGASFSTAYPLPDGTPESSTYTVKVNGESVQVEKRTDHSYVWFAFAGEAEIEVTVSESVSSYTISPKSYEISSTHSGDTISFTLDRPRKLILHEVNELSEMLFIFADPPEDSVPVIDGRTVIDINNCGYTIDNTGSADDTTDIQACIDDISADGGGTLFFPPGKYKADDLYVKDDVNVYLAPGSRLVWSADYAYFYFQDLTSTVKLYGRGVIDGSMIKIDNSDNITLEDILVCPNSSGWWAIEVEGSDGFTAYGVKVFNEWDVTSDGIHNEYSSSYLVDNCFVYGGDDAFAVSAADESPPNIVGSNVRNSVAYAGSSGCKIGTGAYNALIDDVTFENIDIVSFSHRALSINPGDGASVTDVRFKRIRIEKWIDRSLGDENILKFDSWWRDYPPEGETSDIDDVDVVDVDSDISMGSTIEGLDGDNPTNDVNLDGYTIEESLVTNTTNGDITTNAYATNLTFSDTDPSVVSISATDAACSESGGDTCVFTVSRTGSTASEITVDYLVKGTATNGTDYSTITSPVTLGESVASATITITPLTNDDVGYETVLISLENEVHESYGYILGASYQAQAVILDGTGANLFDQDGGASGSGDKGAFEGAALAGSNLVTNGSMEADANWSNEGSPTTNARSDEQAYKETYSRKVTADADWEGIVSDSFSTTTGNIYRITFADYPVDNNFAYFYLSEGDGAGTTLSYDAAPAPNGLEAWSYLTYYAMEKSGGASANVHFTSRNHGACTYYIDSVAVNQIDISWARQSTNTIVIDGAGGYSGDALKITGDGSGDKGASLVLADSADLNSDLTVGVTYILTFWAKVVDGDSVDVEVAESDDTELDSVTVTEDSYTMETLEFTATHATTNKIQLDNLAAGEDIWIDDITLREEARDGFKLGAMDYLNIDAMEINNFPEAGIESSGDHNTFTDLLISGSPIGLSIGGASNAVKYNFLTNNEVGISDTGGTNDYLATVVASSADDGIFVSAAGSKFYNLSIYSAGGDGIELQADAEVKNTIFEAITGSDINENGGTATTAANYADSDGDPLFTAPGSDDFTLQAGSPARDAGTDLGESYKYGLDPISTWPDNVLTLDQDLYGSGREIGAYVFTRTRPRRRIGLLIDKQE